MSKIIKKILRAVIYKFQEAEYQYALFGVALLDILFVLYLSKYSWPVGQTVSLMSLPLLVPLLSYKIWPHHMKFIQPFYWYAVLLLIFPFNAHYLLLLHHLASRWEVVCVLSMLILLFFTDSVTAFVLFMLGLVLSFVVINFNQELTTTEIHRFILFGLINGFSILFFGFFMYRREKFLLQFKQTQLQHEKLQTMSSIATSIAHELRTPLRTISLGAASIKECLPKLIEGYEKARDNHLDVPFVNQITSKNLLSVMENINSEVDSSFTFINMLLTNVDPEKVFSAPVESCSMAECIEDALQRYPFNKHEKDLVSFDQENDFTIECNRLLMTHLLFNLLKNAFYHLSGSKNPKIEIKLNHEGQDNILTFKDTGSGISKDVLPYIFERFYSKTRHGSGIGLSFCKLVVDSIGGKIECHSKLNEYTEFKLSFPDATSSVKHKWIKLINQNLTVLSRDPSI